MMNMYSFTIQEKPPLCLLLSNITQYPMAEKPKFWFLTIIVFIARILLITNFKVIYAKNIERIDDITKSPNDIRSYRGLKLPNELEVLLISDPTTDKAAASMVVGIGSLNDFKEMPGIAHFLEHMLLLSSKKYPQENGFRSFVRDHSGYSNGSTSDDRQNFYFEIDADYLTEALDRFAQIFLEPHMDELAIEREVMTVNSEHETHISIDSWRFSQLERFLSKADHPYNTFTNGNLQTLYTVPKARGISIRDKLLEFYSMWYSSNIMRLAVLGKENLNDLEELVTHLFEQVENKNVEKMIFTYDQHPWGPEEVERKIFAVPIQDAEALKLSFVLPNILHHYKTAPEKYISNLMSHEAPGSLVSVLQQREWCQSIVSEYTTVAGIGFFNFIFSLTRIAVNHIDEILTLAFQYIRLLKTKGIQEWIFEENKKLNEIAFLFRENVSPSSYTSSLASLMHDYPMKDILSYKFLRGRWNPSIIAEILSYLTPDNMYVLIISKSFENIADQRERWYGTKYKVKAIANDLIEKWKKVNPLPEMQIPPPNKFIPENFDLYPLDENEPKNPYIIHESSISRIWFKQDDLLKLPKLAIQFEVFCSHCRQNPSEVMPMNLFVLLLKYSFKKYAYSARLAGLEWSITADLFAIRVRLFGYNDKLTIFFKKLLSTMTSPSELFRVDFSEEDIHFIKERYIASLKNFETEELSKIANYWVSYILSEIAWTRDELLSQNDHLKKFISKLFADIFIQGLIHGNCNKEEAMKIVNILEASFKMSKGLMPEQLLGSRHVGLNYGSNWVYEVYNTHHSNSYCYIYYQCSTESSRNNVLLDLFSLILQHPCYNILRTQEQLGYYVVCNIRRLKGVQGIIITVQSKKHPSYVDARVEELLREVHKMLENMTVNEFELYKKSLEIKKLKKPVQPRTLFNQYWFEITNQLYNFDREVLELKQLYSLTKSDMVNFFMENLYEFSNKRRKLAVHVISRVTNPIPDGTPTTATKIENINTFKNTSTLLHLPPPFQPIAPLGNENKSIL